MTEKELLAKLNSLKNVKPENSWQENNRGLLLSQISGGEDVEEKTVSLFDIIFKKAEWVAQPVGVLVLIVATVFGSGVLSIKAARDTKPGDSLYIAKIISEKTQQAITFDEKQKAKLRIEFASNRAEELVKVLEEDKSDKKTVRVEKLTNDFKKEISVAKVGLEKMTVKDKDDSQQQENKEAEAETQAGDQIFSADFDKTNNGMQIGDSVVSNNVIKESPKKILEEATQLLEKEDYAGTLNKLAEANAVLDKTTSEIKSGEEKEENNATSTEQNIISTSTEEVKATSTKE